MRTNYIVLGIVSCCIAAGQTFSSGSTGADGVLDLTAGNKTVILPASGILNYASVNIPAGRTLSFQLNLSNTPVIMLVQGSVNISGLITISAQGQTPGPGGFYGGAPNQPGFGPGGGKPIAGQQTGSWIGPLSLVPIIGGSGGAGTSFDCDYYVTGSPAGGGGGGAIAIASSSSITLAASGSILANGSINYACPSGQQPGFSGGNGAIRLVSNNISVAGSLSAAIVRIEGPTGSVSYAGTGTAPVIATINPKITPVNPPSLTILTIGGYPVPSYSGSSFNTIDLLLPTQLADPIPVVVQANNVPVGSPISITFSGSGGATSTTATLAGSNAQSTATVYISNLARSTVTYLFVSTTFDPTVIATNVKPTNPSQVAKIELAAGVGERTKYRFLKRDGSEVDLLNVPEQLRSALGLTGAPSRP